MNTESQEPIAWRIERAKALAGAVATPLQMSFSLPSGEQRRYRAVFCGFAEGQTALVPEEAVEAALALGSIKCLVCKHTHRLYSFQSGIEQNVISNEGEGKDVFLIDVSNILALGLGIARTD